ncbi:MarR family winged helix-turn-helix transcriptional regulator [Pseudonocardia sp. CA-107938]|uniref:MarR family winged helix-turn-helix transcriptional regulator n=1 Tax=Pseudonocardia sp. CA-107938 TaxID=3240021 RepID=UPI003D91682B
MKEVDRLLEQSFAGALAVEGVDRRQWQLLNAIAREGSADVLAPFLPDPADRDHAVAVLVERGWVERRGDRLVLTADGTALRARLTVIIGEQRRRITDGISDAEYVATVDVLRRMAGNLAVR